MSTLGQLVWLYISKIVGNGNTSLIINPAKCEYDRVLKLLIECGRLQSQSAETVASLKKWNFINQPQIPQSNACLLTDSGAP